MTFVFFIDEELKEEEEEEEERNTNHRNLRDHRNVSFRFHSQH